MEPGPLNCILYQPPPPNPDGCGAIGGMLGRGNRSTQRKPAPVPLCGAKHLSYGTAMLYLSFLDGSQPEILEMLMLS
jgi:hypothetical protein